MGWIGGDSIAHGIRLEIGLWCLGLGLIAAGAWIGIRAWRDRQRVMAEQRDTIRLLYQQLTAIRGERDE